LPFFRRRVKFRISAREKPGEPAGTLMQPITRYAKSGDVHIAYQTFGAGPINVVMVPGFVSNVENYWEQPDFARFLRRLSSYARVVTFDKRGTGGSDRVTELPGLDVRMDDLRAVMDAAGMEQAALLGISEGAPLSLLFAATYPERCRALALYGSFSRFSYWFPSDEALANFFDYVEKAWGTGGSIQRFAPSRANDAAFQQWWGRNERLGASPAAVTALMHMNSQIDISASFQPSACRRLCFIARKTRLSMSPAGATWPPTFRAPSSSSFRGSIISSTSATAQKRSRTRSRSSSPARPRASRRIVCCPPFCSPIS
jgi:pimeloyl-ACP methyl ester carboxylesterase